MASGVVILSQAFTFFKICKKKKVVFYGPSSIHVKIVDKKHDPGERSHFWTFFDVFLTYFSNLAKLLKIWPGQAPGIDLYCVTSFDALFWVEMVK